MLNLDLWLVSLSSRRRPTLCTSSMLIDVSLCISVRSCCYEIIIGGSEKSLSHLRVKENISPKTHLHDMRLRQFNTSTLPCLAFRWNFVQDQRKGADERAPRKGGIYSVNLLIATILDPANSLSIKASKFRQASSGQVSITQIGADVTTSPLRQCHASRARFYRGLGSRRIVDL